MFPLWWDGEGVLRNRAGVKNMEGFLWLRFMGPPWWGGWGGGGARGPDEIIGRVGPKTRFLIRDLSRFSVECMWDRERRLGRRSCPYVSFLFSRLFLEDPTYSQGNGYTERKTLHLKSITANWLGFLFLSLIPPFVSFVYWLMSADVLARKDEFSQQTLEVQPIYNLNESDNRVGISGTK